MGVFQFRSFVFSQRIMLANYHSKSKHSCQAEPNGVIQQQFTIFPLETFRWVMKYEEQFSAG